MTPDQAVDIRVRLNTAIMALEAALPLALGVEGAPDVDIARALTYARQALAACETEAQP